ncbi:MULTISPECIES: hypothetical protein [Acinetobacter]|uniref:hypothetical protein n=1 Tax=Acinetobacter TaxID=469 RepID=UPI001443E2F9|nr:MULTISPECIES: hypothetical protein [Acinetobacter]
MFFKFRDLKYKGLRVISRSTLALMMIIHLGQQTFASTSDDDVDALLNQAQKVGDVRLTKANKEARTQFDKASSNYSEYSKQLMDKTISNMSNNSGYSGKASRLNNIGFTQQMVNNTSCSGDYSQLASIIKNYQDRDLQGLRTDILNKNVENLIREVKAQISDKKQAIELLKKQAIEHDKVASDAARASSQTWGGPGEDLVAQLNGGRLPLNIQCINSLPYKGICTSIVNQWASVVSKFTAEMLNKCW